MKTLASPRNVWRDRPVTAVGLLVDGDDYYRAFYEAAGRARRHISLAGWQFDSDACLLRGREAEAATMPVTLLAYLDALCHRTPELHVSILAWDFHTVFALEREWMQSQRFNWRTHERLRFVFDSHHPDGASHHQKFAIIDGQLAFVGGLDLCDQRWDDRGHKDPNPLRTSRGIEDKPFHDVQAYIVGRAAVRAIEEIFTSRWQAAAGDALALVEVEPYLSGYAPHGAVPLDTDHIGLSRTDPQGAPEGTPDVCEILTLYRDAIAAAQRLIYIETQYLSSKEIGAALVQRITADGPSLDIAIVINSQGQTPKEEIAIGLAQAKVLSEIRAAAEGTGHRLGVFYTVPHTEAGEEPVRATYIHSKLMIVDDELLTVGSANLTNRSMSLDTELNIVVEAASPDDRLARSIRRMRHELVAEHLGVEDVAAHDASLVATLTDLAVRHEGRLRVHPSPTEAELAAITVIDPHQLPFDPCANETHDSTRSLFTGGLGALWALVTKR